MKNLKTYINEKLIINKNFSNASLYDELKNLPWEVNYGDLICQDENAFNIIMNAVIDRSTKIDKKKAYKIIDTQHTYLVSILISESNMHLSTIEIIYKHGKSSKGFTYGGLQIGNGPLTAGKRGLIVNSVFDVNKKQLFFFSTKYRTDKFEQTFYQIDKETYNEIFSCLNKLMNK